MTYLRKKNNAKTIIYQAGGIEVGDLSVTVADASKFPIEGDFLVTIWDKDTYPDPSDDINAEIILVTGVSGNIFTIERAQEDTLAKSHANGQAVEMLITAGHFAEIENTIDNINVSVVNTLFVSQYDDNGDLSPIVDYFGQGGSFDLDSNYDIQPKETEVSDYFFDYDANDNLMPTEK